MVDFKRGTAILFLDRTRFDYFDAATNRILNFPFGESTISALDVINPTAFETQIHAFVDQNALPPASILVILSPNVLFEKDIVTQEPQEQEAQAQMFLDNVPFESLITKLIPFDQGVRISTTNKTLCDVLKTAFEKKGFLVESIAPYEALGPDFSQVNALTEQNVPVILSMRDTVKNNSFPLIQIPVAGQAKSEQKESLGKSSKEKIRLYGMIGVFVVLIVVLVAVLLSQS